MFDKVLDVRSQQQPEIRLTRTKTLLISMADKCESRSKMCSQMEASCKTRSIMAKREEEPMATSLPCPQIYCTSLLGYNMYTNTPFTI